MLVNCKICKNKIERNEAYKVVVKDKNQYYCNVDEYVAWNEENESRMKVIDISFEIIGETTNTSLMKDLSQIAKVHTYTKIRKYLEDNFMDIDCIMTNKGIDTEYGKIKYFTAVIKNSIGEFREKVEESVEVVQDLDIVKEVKYTPTKRKSFSDLIDEY